jgi:hypothetical protein
MIGDIVQMHPEIGDGQIQSMYEAGAVPNYPIILNPNEKDPEKIKMKPKMEVSEHGDIADVTLLPADLDGNYDYVPDVKSMSIGASDQLMAARQRAIDRLTLNPSVIQLLATEGYQPAIKGLLVDDFEDQGLSDAEKYFTKTQLPQTAGPQMGGTVPPQPELGIPGAPQANPGGAVPEQMAGPSPVQQPGGVPQGLF